MTNLPTASFWMIHGIGQREPTHRHDCYEDAKREAERLARLSPGICFVILEAVEAVAKYEFHTVRLKRQIDDDGIPF